MTKRIGDFQIKIFHIDFNHKLVKSNKFKCLLRFLVWQIKSRIFKKVFVHYWVEDSKFYVRNGETGLTQNIYVGLAEFEDMSFLLHCLREDDFFVDVGSNSGSYSILAGSVVRARVLSIEPIRESYERLEQNFILNGLYIKSKALNIGLGAESGILRMTSKLDTTNQVVLGESESGTTQVEIRTLDEICQSENPVLIKIDVEGWETEVLRGGVETLQNHSLLGIIIELNESGRRYGFSDSDIIKTLKGFGFEPYSYDPLSRSLKNLTDKNLNGGNTIFIRNLFEAKRRISRAPTRDILGVSI